MCPDINWNRPLAVQFIRDYVKQAGAEGVVLGVSGGIDSAVCLALATEALGSDKVWTMWLPYYKEDSEDVDHVLEACGKPQHIRFPISTFVDSAIDLLGGASAVSKLRQGNIMARSRMMFLYDLAKLKNLLVLNTSNLTETLTGYFTKWGDGAGDIAPIGNIYKYEVRALARELNVPDQIISKAPSAGLWEGQTDEDELGISYEDLDDILEGIEAIAKSDIPINAFTTQVRLVSEHGIDKIDHVLKLIQTSSHKRQRIPNPKIWCKL